MTALQLDLWQLPILRTRQPIIIGEGSNLVKFPIVGDPLAILLIIDTIAVKAKQYKWLKDFYRCCKVSLKKLEETWDLLGGILYKTLLNAFLGVEKFGQATEFLLLGGASWVPRR